jgi:glycosyltransferase involved in cell wall biosynthesis
VLGALPKPTEEIAGLFARPEWRYRYFPRPACRGAMYLEQVRLGGALIGADLYHSLHTVVPVLARCAVVTTVYDVMYELFSEYQAAMESRPYRLYRWGVRNRARSAICISQTTADDVCRVWGVPKQRLDVVYLGTTGNWASRTNVEIPGINCAGPVIAAPYNLEPRKNLAGLLAAVARLQLSVPHLKLALFGRAAITPSRENEFHRLVSELNIGESIVLTGVLSDVQLRCLYQKANVFVFPSLYEGFGYPVLEAMASGACVVARGASAMSEVLGDAGVTVETADPEALATALLPLITDPGATLELRGRASERAKEFTVRRMVASTLECYQRAIGRSIVRVTAPT